MAELFRLIEEEYSIKIRKAKKVATFYKKYMLFKNDKCHK